MLKRDKQKESSPSLEVNSLKQTVSPVAQYFDNARKSYVNPTMGKLSVGNSRFMTKRVNNLQHNKSSKHLTTKHSSDDMNKDSPWTKNTPNQVVTS